MNQEIATVQDGFTVDEKVGNGLVRGVLTKFLDGVYKANKTETLPDGTCLIALDVVTCWVCWKGGKPVEHRVTQPGQTHPDRDDLPDQDESLWEAGLNGEPSDPWRNTRYLYLIHPHTGMRFCFVTDSVGGRMAISNLKDQIANVRYAQPNAVPLVKLSSVPMKTRFGMKTRPSFEVIEWRGKATGGAPAQITSHAEAIKQAAPFNDEIGF
jgi:hypothetical protein